MSDPQTTNKLLFTPAHGADVDTWDVPVNANWQGLDQALGGYTTLNANGLSGTVALTTSQIVPLGFIVTGTPSGNLNYQVPSGKGGLWLVRNLATLGTSITLGFSSASGGSTVNIPSGKNLAISADGTSNGMADIDTVPTSVAGGSNSQIQVNIAGVLGGYAGFTFDGSAFHTPQLTVDGNAIFGSGIGSTVTINGTAISAPNGFNFNAGAFQMNAGGMIGVGTASTAALMTIGGLLAITSGGVKYPDGNTQTVAYPGSFITNSLGSDVSLNNAALYFDGPSVSQGTTGTWWASGTVTLNTANGGTMSAKLWDGATVIASSQVQVDVPNQVRTLSLSGYLASPAGDLRISVKCTSTNGLILFNSSGNAKDSTISALRIA